ncbi:hypothetical protein BJF86_02625 [Serinicoccus sp. CNJ-927]|uniref:WcbI family polysaccharide biosynthesis putative acetyltransferase n=1 Tax=unclassified Serinicoccus TaxID=2643101 RepID=UPI00095F2537|nr:MULTISPECIES: WcbI family polysaccharide biosynthesis putative acetyltransferase [unclassified Serinicoccus]OLT18259.1 hypothetical protein BJF80_16020 [Serinicoccus sp. CUA-874]OLT41917.1 hypothetical protein BJF86_02625 [Serinicoccus sp. CNJ-927]
MSDEGRRRHYGVFYGIDPLPDEGLPLLAVHGNCQAEALRVAVGTSGRVSGVRLPPVHELVESDLPHLWRLLERLDVLVAQPVGADYHGMPLGTAQVATRLPEGARVVRVANYFSEALYPEQVLVRHEDEEVVDPPVVPYHDVRRLGLAAGWSGPATLPAEAVRQVAADSGAELRRREQAEGTLPVSDLVAEAGARAGWTVDHPGNEVLLGLAQRVVDDIGGDTPRARVSDPGRVLLSSVRTPLRAEVLQALGLPGEPREHWLVDGEEVTDEEVAQAHLEFYARHPRVVEVGLAKKGARLAALGWRP